MVVQNKVYWVMRGKKLYKIKLCEIYFFFFPLGRRGVNPGPINNLKKYPLLVLFGYLFSMVGSQLSLELRCRSIQVSSQLPAQKYTNLRFLGDRVYVCGVNPF